jgi:hypothetical protein
MIILQTQFQRVSHEVHDHTVHTKGHVVLAGLTYVLEFALALTEGDASSRSKVLVQVGDELVNSSAYGCTCF